MNGNKQDQYLRHIADVKSIPGMTAFDAAMRQPGPSIPRTYEILKGSEQTNFPKPQEVIMAQGAACGVDSGGMLRHFWPGQGLKWAGFLVAQTHDTGSVKTRGSIVLKVETATDENRRRPVYCYGPNEFSIENKPGSVEIGKIRFTQDGRSNVAFRREGDQRPLNLKINRE